MQKLLLLSIALIVYGSLYPWEFRHGPLPPVGSMFYSWNALVADRFSLRDVLINVVLYIPVGFFGHLACARNNAITRFAGPVVLGGVLSTAMEVVQLFTPRRQSSVVDVVANTAGTAVGVMLALFSRQLTNWPAIRTRSADRGAIALLSCGVAYLLYPFFPIFGRTALRYKLHVLAQSQWFDSVMFASAATAWFVAGRLFSALKVPSPRASLMGAAAVALPAQLLVLTRYPAWPHITGAAAGVMVFCACYNRPSVRFDACAVWLLLVVRGLSPFRFTATANAFSWSPFAGSLGFSDWQRATLILVEKTFFYGAALWAIHRAGAGLWKSTAITAGTLALMEAAQVYLPGRTPEITDLILPVLIGFASYWASTSEVAQLSPERSRYRAGLK
jgi:VanZ family protein